MYHYFNLPVSAFGRNVYLTRTVYLLCLCILMLNPCSPWYVLSTFSTLNSMSQCLSIPDIKYLSRKSWFLFFVLLPCDDTEVDLHE